MKFERICKCEKNAWYKCNNLKCIKRLIYVINDINNNVIPLFNWNAKKGNLNIVKYFVGNEILTAKKIRDLAKGRMECLYLACKYGQIEVVKYLINNFNLKMGDIRSPNGNNLALYNASTNGHLDIVKYLVDNTRLTIEDVCSKGNSILKSTSIANHFDIVKYFIEEFDLTINDICSNDNIIIKYACSHGNLNMVKYLLSKRKDGHIDLNEMRGDEGCFLPFNWAAGSNHLNVIKYLDKKFDITLKDIYYKGHSYAIQMAVMFERKELLEYLHDIVIRLGRCPGMNSGKICRKIPEKGERYCKFHYKNAIPF